MCLLKLLFSSNKILKTKIINEYDALTEADKTTNLAVGHAIGGFEGMVAADIHNKANSTITVFEVIYTDKTKKIIETVKGSSSYYKYFKYTNKNKKA